jgi:hypothetical protein
VANHYLQSQAGNMNKTSFLTQEKIFRTVSVFSVAVLLLFAALIKTAGATPIINNIGIDNPELTITFSEFTFPTGTAITDQYSSLGVTFSNELFYNFQPLFFPKDFLSNYNTMPYALNNPVSIIFGDVQDSAAFALQSNNGHTTFTALLEGSYVESFDALTDLSYLPDLKNASNFYGFEGIFFDEIKIESFSLAKAFQIDNIQLSAAPIPEPTTLLLLCTGLIGLTALGRKKLFKNA